MTDRRRSLPPRDEILDLMERIYRFRLTTTSGGNLSIRDDEGTIWITPARVDKGALRRDDIVAIRPDGTIEGLRPPSSELPFHKAIYEARPDLHGIVHAHPVALVAFSLCRKVPDTRLFHQAQHVCGTVGFSPYALPGSDALGRNIASTFAAGHQCTVLENHGVVTGGTTLQEAFERFETLEFVAKTEIKAGWLGTPHFLSPPQIAVADDAPRSLTTGAMHTPTVAERELRRELCEFVQRGYRQRLLTSTQGSFSARTGDDAFLITPYGSDRYRVEPGDIVHVAGGQVEPHRVPSRAAKLHRALYRRHPEIRVIVNAFPVNATAFGVTRTPLEIRAIPESYVVVRGVTSVPFDFPYRDVETLAGTVSMDRPAAIIENDGVLVVGRSTLDTFDRLEVLEATAEALINSRALGGAIPMSESVIMELEAAFDMPRQTVAAPAASPSLPS